MSISSGLQVTTLRWQKSLTGRKNWLSSLMGAASMAFMDIGFFDFLPAAGERQASYAAQPV
jgi:hypothetical protein